MLQDPVTDEKVANSLSFRRDYIDIYQISWGHNDGETFDEPGLLTQTVLMDGANKGRNGLGSIFVSAAGGGNEGKKKGKREQMADFAIGQIEKRCLTFPN